MKKAIWLVALLFSVPVYASDYSKIEIRGSANDEVSTVMDSGLLVKTFSSGAVQQNKLSADAASTTSVSVPRGAKAVMIDVGTNKNLKLLGVTGDTGISLDSSCPVLLPLSSDGNTTIYIKNNSSNNTASLRIYWF